MEVRNELLRSLDIYLGSEVGKLTTFGVSALDLHSRLPDGETALVKVGRPTVLSLHVNARVWSRHDDQWDVRHNYTDPRTGDTQLEDWTLSGRIALVNSKRYSNSQVLCHLAPLHTSVPVGLHVYRVNGVLKYPSLIQSRVAYLFGNLEKYGIPRTGKIAFYTQGDKDSNIFSKTLPMLMNVDKYLAEVVKWYGESIRCILGATQEDLDTSAMSIVYYDEGEGIKQHIDNITSSDLTVGPVASIAIGEGGKYMDLFPTITLDRNLTPVRVITDFSDVVILDGDARLEYAHSVPLGHISEMYSIIFKFRRIRETVGARTSLQLETPINYTIDPTTGAIPPPTAA
jgi:alkylated DNA repair dioxygenase AlkB